MSAILTLKCFHFKHQCVTCSVRQDTQGHAWLLVVLGRKLLAVGVLRKMLVLEKMSLQKTWPLLLKKDSVKDDLRCKSTPRMAGACHNPLHFSLPNLLS
jgi:hypothetical protein